MNEKFASYQYQNTVRDLKDTFTQIVKSKPSLLNLIGIDSPATATKHEWLEDVMSPKAFVLGANYVAASGTMTFADASWVQVSSILTFELATGASTDLTVKVIAVAWNVVTVALYGDDNIDMNLPAWTNVKLIGIPKNDGTEAIANDGREPVVMFNYTQIFDRTAKVSKTAQAIKLYGIDDAISYQEEAQLTDLSYEMVNSIIFGKRVLRANGEAGTMGWILYFLKKAVGNKVNASGAALSGTILNTALALANQNGAINSNALIWHPDQLRKLAWFNTSNLQVSQADRTAGTYVTTYNGDLGTVSTLIVDRNFPKDMVAVVDTSKIKLVPLMDREFSDSDATPNGADYFARRILWEYTLCVKNADTHTLITGLAV